MTQDTNWNQIKQIFSEALELEEDDRKDYLEKACGNDKDLRDEVVSLLNAYEGPGPMGKKTLGSMGVSVFAQFEEQTQKGKRVGPYSLVHLLGHGGMGSVYAAERADGQFEQRVALKLLRTGFTSPNQTRRFLAERQILASLNHEHIARLLDGGVTEEGQPYIVIEYVEGQPVDEYCDVHQLTIRQRLELFVNICEAVQYAHRQLVIHRDLKPSNILITEGRIVKLLDFGIAKVLNPEKVLAGEPALTQTGLMPLTPAYASPEQIRGETVSTASDVYQLGVVLYELLTGGRPYDVAGRTPSEIEQVICEKPPTRPSTLLSETGSTMVDSKTEAQLRQISVARRTNPAQLRKRLRGDLDTIVLKALRKEPARRYDSAEQLATDIRRYLSGRPVEAHPDSWLYRAGKFTQRHKRALFAATFVLIGVTGLITYYTWQLTQERDFAQMEAEKAEQVSTFLTDMFKSADPGEARGETITARELLDRGTERIDELASQPEVQAGMMDVIGQVYTNLGFYEEAHPILEQALELRSQLYGDIHPETAQSHVHLATVLHDLGNYHQAIPHFEKALEIFRIIPGHISPEYASALAISGSIEQARRNIEVAMVLQQEALEMRIDLFGPDHPEVASSYNDIAILYEQLNNLEDAETGYRDALRIIRIKEIDNTVLLAQILSNLGRVLMNKGAFMEAEERLMESLQIRKYLFGDNHQNTGWVVHSLANLNRNRGEYSSAERLYEESLSILREAMGKSHPLVAQVLVDRGEMYMQTDNYPQAERTFREALTMYEETLNKGHSHITSTRRKLGSSLAQLGRFEEAEELLLKSLAGARGLVAENETFHAYQYSFRSVLEELVTLYESWDRANHASKYQSMLADF